MRLCSTPEGGIVPAVQFHTSPTAHISRPQRHRKGLVLLGAALALGSLTPAALAQSATDLAPQADTALYENRPIAAVVLRSNIKDSADQIVPISELAQREAYNNIRSTPGTIFDLDLINDDLRRLNRLGLFTTVELFVGVNDDGMVEVVFELAERSLIADVQVTGNTKINDAEIAGVVDVFPGTPVDRFQIDRSARRIENLYRQKGYYYARVNVDEEELAAALTKQGAS